MAEAEEPRRKFVWAPDMEKLREAIEKAKTEAEEAIERAEGMADEFEDSNDLLQRLAHVVLAVRDRQRGLIDERALNDEIEKATDGVGWPDWLVSELAATT